MAALLPVGTIVTVTQPAFGHRAAHSYRARVCGYDMGRTKYELDYELWPGHFMDGGGWWAFPSWVSADGGQP